MALGAVAATGWCRVRHTMAAAANTSTTRAMISPHRRIDDALDDALDDAFDDGASGHLRWVDGFDGGAESSTRAIIANGIGSWIVDQRLLVLGLWRGYDGDGWRRLIGRTTLHHRDDVIGGGASCASAAIGPKGTHRRVRRHQCMTKRRWIPAGRRARRRRERIMALLETVTQQLDELVAQSVARGSKTVLLRRLEHRAAQLVGGLPTGFDIHRQRLGNHAVQSAGQLGPHRGRRREVPRHDRLHRRELRIPLKQPLAGQQLPQDDPQREHVASPVEALGAALLRRHVRAFAFERPCMRGLRCLRRFGDSEVEQLHVAPRADHQVVGRDVAMDQTQRLPARVRQLMGSMSSTTCLLDDADRHGRRQQLFGPVGRQGQLANRTARDILHDEEVTLVILGQLMDLHHVGVDQARHESRLRNEHVDDVRFTRQVRQQPFGDDEPFETRRAKLPRQPDFGHASGCKSRERLDARRSCNGARLVLGGHRRQRPVILARQTVQ